MFLAKTTELGSCLQHLYRLLLLSANAFLLFFTDPTFSAVLYSLTRHLCQELIHNGQLFVILIYTKILYIQFFKNYL